MSKKIKSILLGYTLLSTACLLSISGAMMAPILGSIGKEFVGIKPIILKLTVSISFLPQILVCLMVGRFVSGKVKKRNILIIGLILYLVAGCIGFLSPNIQVLLISRLIIGVSIGIISTIGPSLIADNYDGEKREKMMGYNMAFLNIGSVIGSLTAGIFATINWRTVFLLNSFAFLTLLFSIFLIKEQELEDEKEEKVRINPQIFKLFSYCIIITILFGTIATNLSLYIEGEKLGGPEFVGIIMASSGIVSFLSGLFLTNIMKLLKQTFILVVLLVAMVGFGLIAFGPSGIIVLIGVCLIFSANGLLIPIILLKGTNIVEQSLRTLAVSIINAGLSIGMFISPLIFELLGKVFNNNAPNFSYNIAFLICIIILFIYFSKVLDKEKLIEILKINNQIT